MAQFTFTNNTYAGADVAGYMANTLLEADSVKRDLWTVLTNVKARKIILDVDDTVVLQNPSGTFVDQGTTALQNESYLDPVVYEFMKQEQWDNLIKSWEVSEIKHGSFADYEGVVDLSNFVLGRYIEKIQIANERLYFLGKVNVTEASFTAPYQGLLGQIAANGGTYALSLSNNGSLGNSNSQGITAISVNPTTKVATCTVGSTATLNLQNGDVVTLSQVSGSLSDTIYGSPNGQSYWITNVTATTFQLFRNYNEVNHRNNAQFNGTATAISGPVAILSVINATNVIPVLASVYAQMDQADRMQEDFNILLPNHVGYAFEQAQANKATNVLDAFVNKKMYEYLGAKLQKMNHFQGNTILCIRRSNMFLGVDLLDDMNNLSSVYLKPYTNDDVVRTKARMKSCTQVKFFNEVLYYSY